jgi:hypothetical protein
MSNLKIQPAVAFAAGTTPLRAICLISRRPAARVRGVPIAGSRLLVRIRAH